MRPRTQKQPQDKKELCRVLDYVKAVKKEKKKKKKKKKKRLVYNPNSFQYRGSKVTS